MIKKRFIFHASRFIKDQSGQSLVEIIIALVIGVVIIGAAVITLMTSFKSGAESKNIQIATALAQDSLDKIKTISESNWTSVYNLNKGSTSAYYVYYNASTTAYEIRSGYETSTIEGKIFKRYFYAENINRSQCGLADVTSTAISAYCNNPSVWLPVSSYVGEDPSTQKITVVIQWDSDRRSISQSQYIMRLGNQVFQQSDWSGGPNQEYFSTSTQGTIVNNKFTTSTNINYSSSSGEMWLVSNLTNGFLISSVFDSFIANGAAINSIMWVGPAPVSDEYVSFQVASSNDSSGPWVYIGYDGTASTYYRPSQPGIPVTINPASQNNKRYFRYKVFLWPNSTFTASSKIDNIILGWSR